jgi:hypothetical protein
LAEVAQATVAEGAIFKDGARQDSDQEMEVMVG